MNILGTEFDILEAICTPGVDDMAKNVAFRSLNDLAEMCNNELLQGLIGRIKDKNHLCIIVLD
jgi:hypothetical protein